MLRSAPPTDQALTDATKNVIRGWVEEKLTQWRSSGSLALDLTGGVVPMAWARIVDWAAWLDLPLTPQDWAALALPALTLADDALRAWLRRRYTADGWMMLRDQLENWRPSAVVGVPKLVPALPDDLVTRTLAAIGDPTVDDHDRRRAVDALVEAGEGPAVRSWAAKPTPAWLLPTLVKLGDCDAEAELIRSIAASPASLPDWPLRGQQRLLADVRCATSAADLQALVRSGFIAGHQTNDLEPVLHAMEHCAGPAVLKLYDELINDPLIPGAPFLYYERQRALDVLVEQEAQTRLACLDTAAATVRTALPTPAHM